VSEDRSLGHEGSPDPAADVAEHEALPDDDVADAECVDVPPVGVGPPDVATSDVPVGPPMGPLSDGDGGTGPLLLLQNICTEQKRCWRLGPRPTTAVIAAALTSATRRPISALAAPRWGRRRSGNTRMRMRMVRHVGSWWGGIGPLADRGRRSARGRTQSPRGSDSTQIHAQNQ
jgi:hypothetical protein